MFSSGFTNLHIKAVLLTLTIYKSITTAIYC